MIRDGDNRLFLTKSLLLGTLETSGLRVGKGSVTLLLNKWLFGVLNSTSPPPQPPTQLLTLSPEVVRSPSPEVFKQGLHGLLTGYAWVGD